MPGSPIKDAYSFLRRFDAKKRRLDEAMDELRERDTPGIALGLLDSAVRHGPLLDLLISHASTVKTNKMERAVLAAMRLGVASYLRGAPAYAAVNEAVELLPANHRARGLVNAVTRRVSEIVSVRPITDDELAGLKRADEKTVAELITPLRMPFGESAIAQGRFALFPADMKARLALLAGLPGWLYARLENSLEPNEIAQVCLSCALPPALWLRIVKGRESQAMKALEQIPHVMTNGESCHARPSRASGSSDEGGHPESSLRLDSRLRGNDARSDNLPSDSPNHLVSNAIRIQRADGGDIFRSQAFKDGAFTVQDYAAQLPVLAAKPQAGWRCLDLCAAPGGKTAQLAEAVGEKGLVVAFDRSDEKLERIQQNIARLGLANVACASGDGTSVKLDGKGRFDLVLADVPCTNTGVMGRRPDVKERLREKDVESLGAVQRALLENAAAHARSGGTVVYSTCSLLDEENGALVRAFLDAQGGDDSGWQFMDERLTLPVPGDHDGGYYAVLRKP